MEIISRDKPMNKEAIKRKWYSNFRSKKDIVIPAGTVFTNIDGYMTQWVDGNFEAIVGLTPNTAGRFVYGIEQLEELNDWFEEV